MCPTVHNVSIHIFGTNMACYGLQVTCSPTTGPHFGFGSSSSAFVKKVKKRKRYRRKKYVPSERSE